eukprot:gene1674-2017_t
MQLAKAPLARPVLAARPAARPVVRCFAAKRDEESVKPAVATVAAVVTAGLLLQSTVAVEPALAARSGGRAGASSFSARRSYAAPSRAAPQVNSYSTTIVAAPPVYSSFSPFGGFGYGGFGFGMPMVMPFPFFGGLLQFMFLMLAVSFVFNVIKGALGGGSSKSKSQDWDDL